jgi:hypothetical protein
MIYRATPHSTTGKSPSELLQNRKMRLKLPSVIPKPEGRMQEEAKAKHEAERKKQKEYADKRRRAKVKPVLVGDEVLVKQDKTTTKPPWDPKPFKVVEVKGTQVTATRGQMERTRNVEKMKVLKKRPKYLETNKKVKPERPEDSEDDDWLDDMDLGPPQAQAGEENAEAAGVIPAHQPLPDSSTEEDEPFHGWEPLDEPFHGWEPEEQMHQEVARLRDALTRQPARQRRASVPPNRLINEMERADEDGRQPEREASMGAAETRLRTPGTTPDTSAHEQGLQVDRDTTRRRRSPRREYQSWFTIGGLVNIARAEAIDPTWSGVDEP